MADLISFQKRAGFARKQSEIKHWFSRSNSNLEKRIDTMPFPSVFYRRSLAGLTCIAALTLSGCAALRHTVFHAADTIPTPAQADAAVRETAFTPEDIRENLLDPLPAQSKTPGLVVCDPVTVDPARAAFGAGCGRWLHLSAAGQGALGQTPNWQSLYRSKAELKRSDLQLGLPDAKQLSGMTGVPYIALGTLTGTPEHGSLEYQIWAVPAGTAVGKPIRITGSEQEIIDSLPGVARALDAALGVTHPDVSGPVGLTPKELASLGQDATQSTVLSEVQKAELFALSPNCPLANVVFISRGGWLYRTQLATLATHLFTLSPKNPLAYGLLAEVDANLLMPVSSTLALDRAAYPANALFALADVKRLRIIGDWTNEERVAQIVAGDAPGSPEAWLTYAFTMMEKASRLRKGRFSDEITSSEWSALNTSYGLQARAADEAVTLDPAFGRAWERLAQAATVADSPKLAAAAFWKALALDDDKAEVYCWGLEMFQPKWRGDPAILDTVAERAAADPSLDADQVRAVALSLKAADETSQRTALLDAALRRQRDFVSKEPANGYAHWNLGAVLFQHGDEFEATREYRTAVRLLPKNAAVLFSLGATLQDRKMMPQSIAPLTEAIALDPMLLNAHYDLGYALKESGKVVDAERLFHQELALQPGSMEAHFALGQAYEMEKQPTLAIAEYQQARDRLESFWIVYVRLSILLDEQKRYDEALAIGKEALNMSEEDPDNNYTTVIMTTVADCYLNKHDPDACISECKEQLAVKADDPFAYENLAEAYLQKGDMAQARANWEKAARLDTVGQVGMDARKFLAKYPGT